jgi:hypothetical protein
MILRSGVAVLLAASLIAACGGGAADGERPLTVRLDVRDGALRAPGEQCAGSMPFLYLHATAPYRLEDGDGATVARGRLPQGRAVPALQEELGVPRVPTFCRMRFAVRAPQRREYRLVVDEREPLRFSASSDRTVELSVP